MSVSKTDIWVYAHWLGMKAPKCIGMLSAHYGKGRKSFSFEYNTNWLQSEEQFLLDPDIGWYSGSQFPNQKENFGIFLDSMPDRWGRTLIQRKAALTAKEKGKSGATLYDIDFLLGIQDETRMGALRFKLDPNGEFLSKDDNYPVPLWSSIRELQHAAAEIESDKNSEEIKKWLGILIAPGSSLGGARPKANIIDDQKQLWIAKFPSKNDNINKGAWEYLAYRLALGAGIQMSESKIIRIANQYHTFFTKRFDRRKESRIHFASAMTMTGNNEEIIKTSPPSYLDLAEFIQFSGTNISTELHQLWRRIVFNIAISNTDDHLRNHGFLLTPKGWRLSPAYDINPSIEKDGLSLNIDEQDNALDFELAKSVGEYFQLSTTQMNEIIQEVKTSVSRWQDIASEIRISKAEIELMSNAFRI